jgi:hypothetical protein
LKPVRAQDLDQYERCWGPIFGRFPGLDWDSLSPPPVPSRIRIYTPRMYTYVGDEAGTEPYIYDCKHCQEAVGKRKKVSKPWDVVCYSCRTKLAGEIAVKSRLRKLTKQL